MGLTMYFSLTGLACWRPMGPVGRIWYSLATPTAARCACRSLERYLPPTRDFWPQVTAGVHTAGQAQVVVSRGLGNGTPFPRLWNGPELVAVTLRSAESFPENG